MKNSLRNFSMMLEALAELQPELEKVETKPVPAAPNLSIALSELGPLPREALFLGLASDGLPVLLNLLDPHPGPILVTADSGAGKTGFIQFLARAATEMHNPHEVQFGVITNYPDEWEQFSGMEHCIGIFPTYHDSAVEFLHSLSGWAHSNKGSSQSILLLIDDLESMNELDFDAQQTLRWLLLRGTSRRVWPFLTLNAERITQVQAWMDAFRTRIFGHIKESRYAERLTNIPGTKFNDLQPGLQFALREGDQWLKFWIPELE